MKPIYYYELDLTIKMARSSLYKHTWFVSKVEPDKISEHLKTNAEDFDRLLYIAFKKQADKVRNSKITNVRIDVIGYIKT